MYDKRKGYSMLAIFTHLVEVQNHVVDTVLLGDVEVKCHNSAGLVRHIDACCDGSVASALHRSAKHELKIMRRALISIHRLAHVSMAARGDGCIEGLLACRIGVALVAGTAKANK